MEKLSLRLSPEQVDNQCKILLSQTRLSGQALAALTALQTFITTSADPGEKIGIAYQDIKAILDRHITVAREQVMEDNLNRLLLALDEQNLSEIQGAHAALSRNGFHQTVLSAIQRMPDARLHPAAHWVAEWHRDAKARAEAASPYPDALDLRAAGISPARFSAMSELNTYLQEAIS
jgi:hypothetical protein